MSTALLAAVAAVALLGGCGQDGDSTGPAPPSPGTARTLTIPGAGEALAWGHGANAVVLAHGAAFDAASWEPQAAAIADRGLLVLAPEDTSPEALAATVAWARAEGAEQVTLLGASAGADAALRAVAADPGAVDRLITLSANGVVTGLGPVPKLFIASEDEGAAGVATELAGSAEGDANELLLLPGSAHAQAIFDGESAGAALEAILTALGSR